MIIYCVKKFDAFVDFEKVINNFVSMVTPYGTIDIVDSTIRDPSLLPRYVIKFQFDCQASNAPYCERYLQGYLFNLLGEFY